MIKPRPKQKLRSNQFNDGIIYAASPKIKFIDRIRILFGAKIVFENQIETQNLMGKYSITDRFFVETLRGKFFRPKQQISDPKHSNL